MQVLEQIPDSVKVVTATSAPVMHYFFGVSVEEWTFILSAIVSILFIVEKTPMLIRRVREFREWWKNRGKR